MTILKTCVDMIRSMNYFGYDIEEKLHKDLGYRSLSELDELIVRLEKARDSVEDNANESLHSVSKKELPDDQDYGEDDGYYYYVSNEIESDNVTRPAINETSEKVLQETTTNSPNVTVSARPEIEKNELNENTFAEDVTTSPADTATTTEEALQELELNRTKRSSPEEGREVGTRQFSPPTTVDDPRMLAAKLLGMLPKLKGPDGKTLLRKLLGKEQHRSMKGDGGGGGGEGEVSQMMKQFLEENELMLKEVLKQDDLQQMLDGFDIDGGGFPGDDIIPMSSIYNTRRRGDTATTERTTRRHGRPTASYKKTRKSANKKRKSGQQRKKANRANTTAATGGKKRRPIQLTVMRRPDLDDRHQDEEGAGDGEPLLEEEDSEDDLVVVESKEDVGVAPSRYSPDTRPIRPRPQPQPPTFTSQAAEYIPQLPESVTIPSMFDNSWVKEMQAAASGQSSTANTIIGSIPIFGSMLQSYMRSDPEPSPSPPPTAQVQPNPPVAAIPKPAQQAPAAAIPAAATAAGGGSSGTYTYQRPSVNTALTAGSAMDQLASFVLEPMFGGASTVTTYLLPMLALGASLAGYGPALPFAGLGGVLRRAEDRPLPPLRPTREPDTSQRQRETSSNRPSTRYKSRYV